VFTIAFTRSIPPLRPLHWLPVPYQSVLLLIRVQRVVLHALHTPVRKLNSY